MQGLVKGKGNKIRRPAKTAKTESQLAVCRLPAARDVRLFKLPDDDEPWLKLLNKTTEKALHYSYNLYRLK